MEDGLTSSDSVRYAVVCACIFCPSKGNGDKDCQCHLRFICFTYTIHRQWCPRERPITPWKDPLEKPLGKTPALGELLRGLSRWKFPGVFSWDIIDGVYCMYRYVWSNHPSILWSRMVLRIFWHYKSTKLNVVLYIHSTKYIRINKQT